MEIECNMNSNSIHLQNHQSSPPPFYYNLPGHELTRGTLCRYEELTKPRLINSMQTSIPNKYLPHYDMMYMPMYTLPPRQQEMYDSTNNIRQTIPSRKNNSRQTIASTTNPYVTMPYKEYKEMKSTFQPSKKHGLSSRRKKSKYVSLDCEMVGVGPNGSESAVARVCIIDWSETILLDTHVKVNKPVTDYRTLVSGVRAEDLKSDKAMSVKQCKRVVKKLISKKILVGHGLDNDLKALGISHPSKDIRDTAKFPPYMALCGSPYHHDHHQYQSPVLNTPSADIAGTYAINKFLLEDNLIDIDCSSTISSLSSSSSSQEVDDEPSSPTKPAGQMIHLRPQKLKDLAKEYCNMIIQKKGAEHCPLEDAKAALLLYKRARRYWENDESSSHAVPASDSFEGDSPLVVAAKYGLLVEQ